MYKHALTLTVSLLALVVLFTLLAQAASPRLDADTIKAGLRTATPEEDGFVDMVVDRVDQGKLPASLVHSTFQYARKKRRHRFQYFKRALIIRAAAIGKPLPV